MPRKDPPVKSKALDPAGKGIRRAASRSSGSVTLQDVARLAGVAPITVSRVINRPELVTRKTMQLVRQAITTTGYVPNLLAGGLASKRSRLVAAIVPSVGNSMFTEVFEALTERLGEAGYTVVLGLSGYGESREDELLAAVLSRKPDAVFMIGVSHSAETRQRLQAANIPVVESWDLTATPIDMLIGFSQEKVGEAVARHFLAKGCRRFAGVSASDSRALVRWRSFEQAMLRHGATVSGALVDAPGTLQGGRAGLTELLEGAAAPEAVFATSDALAHGVLTEAQARGLSVPADLAVIGFGDLEFAAYTHPALSTVRIDRYGIGVRAAEAILAKLRGQADIEKIVDIGFEIVERESS